MAQATRMPPYNAEAEAGFLSSVLLDEAILDRLPAGFRPDHLFRRAHRVVYDAILAVRGRGLAIDSLTVEDELRKDPQRWEQVGDLSGFLDICGAAPHAANGLYYAELVLAYGVRREAIRITTQLLETLYGPDEETEPLLERAATSLVTLAASGSEEHVATMAEVADEFEAVMERRMQGEIEGFSTGFPMLDKKIGGHAPSRVIIYAARPAQGKTGYAMTTAVVAAKLGYRGLIVSQEMGRLQLFERAVSGEGRIDNVKLRDIAYLDERAAGWTRREMAAATGRLRPLPLRIDDTAGRTAAQVESLSRRLHASEGLDFLVVDYVQLLEAEPGSKKSRQEVVAEISRRMKRLAMSLRIPVILLAQLNRDVEKREDKRPRMSDLRESGALEQDADQVILLHRPEYYDPNDRPGEADLIVGKNRWGPTGTVPVNFHGPTTRFSPLARDDGDYAGDAPF